MNLNVLQEYYSNCFLDSNLLSMFGLNAQQGHDINTSSTINLIVNN